MSVYNTKVIGFFAYASPSEVVCTDGAACVIAGSQKTRKHTIKKTRFGEIIQGMQLGAAYAFDKDAYNRFYPLARQIELNIQPADFKKNKLKGMRFFTVQI